MNETTENQGMDTESPKPQPPSRKTKFLAIIGFGAVTTLFFFLISIPVSFKKESWIVQPQTRTIQRKISRLAKLLDDHYKKNDIYPVNLNDLFEKGKEEFWIEYETQDYWRNPLVYETDGKSWEILSYGRDGKPGGVSIDADFFCTNHMFELGTMENAVADAQPTLGQVILTDRLWVFSVIFFIGPVWVGLFLWGSAALLGIPVISGPMNRTQAITSGIALVIVSLFWAWGFSIAFMIPTGH